MLFDRDENIVIITQEKASVKTLVNNIEQVYDVLEAIGAAGIKTIEVFNKIDNNRSWS